MLHVYAFAPPPHLNINLRQTFVTQSIYGHKNRSLHENHQQHTRCDALCVFIIHFVIKDTPNQFRWRYIHFVRSFTHSLLYGCVFVFHPWDSKWNEILQTENQIRSVRSQTWQKNKRCENLNSCLELLPSEKHRK